MIIKFFEYTGNRMLDFDARTRSALERLAGRTMCIEFAGVGKKLYVRFQPQRVEFVDDWPERPDLTLRGTPLAFARYALAGDSAGAGSGGVEIEGDAVLAQHFTRVLKQLDVDWEEWLSQYVGDVAAHQVGRLARSFDDWARTTADTLRRNAAEYLTEESRVLVSSRRVSRFLTEVDTLRSDVERLEQRVLRLRSRLPG